MVTQMTNNNYEYITHFHDIFVIVSVDKASNNFGIVCKPFYLYVIKKELRIVEDHNTLGNEIYNPTLRPDKKLYLFHEWKLLDTFCIKLPDINRKIPLLYWTSKQHKCPYNIADSTQSMIIFGKQKTTTSVFINRCGTWRLYRQRSCWVSCHISRWAYTQSLKFMNSKY